MASSSARRSLAAHRYTTIGMVSFYTLIAVRMGLIARFGDVKDSPIGIRLLDVFAHLEWNNAVLSNNFQALSRSFSHIDQSDTITAVLIGLRDD
jgi:hypothetical protein